MTGGQHSHQPAPDAAPPKRRIYSQIQQLAFVLGHAARNGESGDAPRAHRHQQVVLQVLRYVPLRRLRRRSLNLSNRSQIAAGAGTEFKAQTGPRPAPYAPILPDNSPARAGSIRWVLNPADTGAFVYSCRSPTPSSSTSDFAPGARNSVAPFSRTGGPSVTCSVQAMGRSVALSFSTASTTSTARPPSAMRRSNCNCACGRRARCVNPVWVAVTSYATTEASPCTVSPAAASSADGPPKMSMQRLCPMMPLSSLLSASAPYSGCFRGS